MANFKVTLERKTAKRLNSDTLEEHLEYLVSRATAGDRKAWTNTKYNVSGPKRESGGHAYAITLTFERSRLGKEPSGEQLTNELKSIMEYLTKAATSTKFKPAWSVGDPQPSWSTSVVMGAESDGCDILPFERALTFEELVIPEVLVSGTDEEIEQHPAFQGIYARAAHIRIIGSSLKRMVVTKGAKRNHVLLHGLPGCAKSHILMGWMNVLGPGAYFTINANSATRAGIEKLFLDRFRQTGVPPVCFVEEIEKTQEAILTVWLSILDERAEVRKINYREQARIEAKVLSIATANDKVLFDRLHGGRPSHPGALSSRFTKKLYVPRPDKDVMERILLRDINMYGGKKAWVKPCLEIAEQIGTNDPRIVMSLLDGQDRLLDNGYREDMLSIYKMEDNDHWQEDRDEIEED